ncbi:MMPL family transporter [Paenibacillus paeoniae]|uniref:Membrane transport protein MMPL domain-containing protein n=1 Tax=Paenibacillus paeoniae TaxID=2292705 RepID=A0A371P6Q0_9BACL|nr:MMPL family transporter [Paenibacillus paeoniae]REK71617.1 hypothetical protein DX130_21765 [Paenibacillus paeoniae]
MFCIVSGMCAFLAYLYSRRDSWPAFSASVLTVGILFGLAMDYEVFLVSRKWEKYSRTGGGRKAVYSGMANSGGVVTAGRLIIIVVFASFVFVEERA